MKLDFHPKNSTNFVENFPRNSTLRNSTALDWDEKKEEGDHYCSNYDPINVVIVGGGPIGLMYAVELASSFMEYNKSELLHRNNVNILKFEQYTEEFCSDWNSPLQITLIEKRKEYTRHHLWFDIEVKGFYEKLLAWGLNETQFLETKSLYTHRNLLSEDNTNNVDHEVVTIRCSALENFLSELLQKTFYRFTRFINGEVISLNAANSHMMNERNIGNKNDTKNVTIRDGDLINNYVGLTDGRIFQYQMLFVASGTSSFSFDIGATHNYGEKMKSRSEPPFNISQRQHNGNLYHHYIIDENLDEIKQSNDGLYQLSLLVLLPTDPLTLHCPKEKVINRPFYPSFYIAGVTSVFKRFFNETCEIQILLDYTLGKEILLDIEDHHMSTEDKSLCVPSQLPEKKPMKLQMLLEKIFHLVLEVPSPYTSVDKAIDDTSSKQNVSYDFNDSKGESISFQDKVWGMYTVIVLKIKVMSAFPTVALINKNKRENRNRNQEQIINTNQQNTVKKNKQPLKIDRSFIFYVGDASISAHYRLGVGINHAYERMLLLQPVLSALYSSIDVNTVNATTSPLLKVNNKSILSGQNLMKKMKMYVKQSESLVAELINRECRTIILESICGLIVYDEMIYKAQLPKKGDLASTSLSISTSTESLSCGLLDTDYMEISDSSDIAHICSEYQRRKSNQEHTM